MKRFLTGTAMMAALAAVPATASADFLDFTVNESAVPGTVANTFTADYINGIYSELLVFSGTTYQAAAYATFGQYASNEGTVLETSQLNGFGATGYRMYALFRASGDVCGANLCGSGSAELKIFVDPNQNTTFAGILADAANLPTAAGVTLDDFELLHAIGGTGTGVPGTPGAFEIVFPNPTLTAPGGFNYWPTLAPPTVFRLVSNGDFSNFQFTGTQTVTGDLSVVFQDTSVPEPATLSLLGLGLAAAAWSRRRRKTA